MIASGKVYKSSHSIPILFDTEDQVQCDLLHEMCAVFQEYSDIEALSERFFVLVLTPGLAREMRP